MKNFAFKETDQEGLETLKAIAGADRFNEWMYRTIQPYCKGKILEVGSGIGNISAFFIRDRQEIMLSDIRQAYCDYLRTQFDGKALGVMQLDLVHPSFNEEYADYLSGFDTVFALNVVEHIHDHQLALSNATKLLRSGGNLVVLVPAYRQLYNRFDKELEHYRRYTRKELIELMSPHVSIIHSRYFNCAGIPGWFISGKILNKKTIPRGQMGLFNKLVPLFRLIDRLIGNRIGLSVVVAGRKEST